MKVYSLRILAHIVNEEESEILQTANGGVAFLLSLVKSAISSKDHREHEIIGSRASALELLHGLNKLAVNDSNKNEIAKQGGIPVFTRMLESDFSDDEHIAAAKALWNLAFLEDTRKCPQLQTSIKGRSSCLNSCKNAVSGSFSNVFIKMVNVSLILISNQTIRWYSLISFCAMEKRERHLGRNTWYA